MQQALDEGDAETLCAVAHKMLPTFTMIEAHKAIQPLKDLEQQRGSQTLTEEMIRKAQAIIECAKKWYKQSDNSIFTMKKICRLIFSQKSVYLWDKYCNRTE